MPRKKLPTDERERRRTAAREKYRKQHQLIAVRKCTADKLEMIGEALNISVRDTIEMLVDWYQRQEAPLVLSQPNHEQPTEHDQEEEDDDSSPPTQVPFHLSYKSSLMKSHLINSDPNFLFRFPPRRRKRQETKLKKKKKKKKKKKEIREKAPISMLVATPAHDPPTGSSHYLYYDQTFDRPTGSSGDLSHDQPSSLSVNTASDLRSEKVASEVIRNKSYIDSLHEVRAKKVACDPSGGRGEISDDPSGDQSGEVGQESGDLSHHGSKWNGVKIKLEVEKEPPPDNQAMMDAFQIKLEPEEYDGY